MYDSIFASLDHSSFKISFTVVHVALNGSITKVGGASGYATSIALY